MAAFLGDNPGSASLLSALDPNRCWGSVGRTGQAPRSHNRKARFLCQQCLCAATKEVREEVASAVRRWVSESSAELQLLAGLSHAPGTVPSTGAQPRGPRELGQHMTSLKGEGHQTQLSWKPSVPGPMWRFFTVQGFMGISCPQWCFSMCGASGCQKVCHPQSRGISQCPGSAELKSP